MCEREFILSHLLQKYCSFKCAKISQRKKQKEWYQKHREEAKVLCKKYYKNHIKEINTYNKKYNEIYYQRPEAIAKRRAWIREYGKIMRRTDIQFCMKHRLENRLLKALQKYGDGKKRKASKYGIDWNICCKKLIETKPADFEERKFHIDHIKPLSSFDLTDIEQIREAFAPENLQWLEAKENLSKGDKWNGDAF